MNRTSVDSYLAEGCGRCDKFQTPDCKVHLWTAPLVELRALLKGAGFGEELKWGQPCYTFEGKNVVMLVAMREYVALSFLQGTLLADPAGLLEAPGPNSQAVRYLRFTSAEDLGEKRAIAEAFVEAAKVLARSDAKVEFARAPEPVPEELQAVLDADPAVAAAFAALTPGRRRSHILHVSGAKQAASRRSRAEKCVPKILAGQGFLDR
jgi:uncharacterized protein YdeI (YjbR/CyaY-like superfamily)